MSPLVASTRAELLRLRRWPVLWVLVSVWAGLNLTFVYVFNYIAYRSGSTSTITEGAPPEALLADIVPSGIPEALVQGMPMFGGAILLILGALTVGSGYGWGTWKTVLTQGPGRLASFGGTMGALALIVGAVVLGTLVIDAGVSAVLAGLESQPLDFPPVQDLASAVGTGILVLGMWTAAGVLVGLLARGPALAVGLGLVWALVVENLLRGVSGLLPGLAAVTDHLPGTAAGSLVGALGTGTDADGDGTPGVLSILDGGTATGVLLVYLVGFVVVGLFLVRRRDLG